MTGMLIHEISGLCSLIKDRTMIILVNMPVLTKKSQTASTTDVEI